MDLFNKCYEFTLPDEVKKMGLYPYFHPISENDGPVVYMNDQRTIMAGSNNYLGFTTDPRVKEAAKTAIEKYGTGCSGSRFLNGTLDIHLELEEELADFVNKEAAILFSTGFQSNQGTIVPLISKEDYILSDSENHNSIVQGTLIAKGLHKKDMLLKYEHNNMEDLLEKISKLPNDAPKLIVTDGIFSMNGNIVNLPELIKIARQYNARVMVDDAHSLGVIGDNGRGTASHFSMTSDVDIIMGTFSKSLASLGGFIASEKAVINYIKHKSSAVIFSASMPPGQVAATRKALEIMKMEPERIEKLHRNSDRARAGLKNLGFKVSDGNTPVVPVIIGDDFLTFSFWRKLLDNGVFTNPIIYPASPKGMQLIRTSFMATHEDEHIDTVIEKFEKVGKELGILEMVA